MKWREKVERALLVQLDVVHDDYSILNYHDSNLDCDLIHFE